MLNARVNFIFYFVTLCISFFSRKIFLKYLGDDFLGLSGATGNLLSLLNLAELGIGSIIGYVLYKPLYEEDHQKICEIISVFGFLYRVIGFIILTGGVILSFFLPLIFSDTEFSLWLIYFLFYAFLTGNLFGYFINYRYTLLGADQKGYMVTIYFQIGSVLKTLIQMTTAYYTKSYILWIIIELCFNIIYCFLINRKIDKEYPWLITSYADGKRLYKDYPVIITKTKQMFVHTLGTVARFQLLPLLLFPFSSISAVTYYGNYSLITAKVSGLANSVLNSTGAGVGNLIAENNITKTMKVYWELTAIRFFFAGIAVFSLFHFITPFVCLWIGSKYALSNTILLIILCDLFIMQIRGTNDQFINGYGLFQDVWAPMAEIILVIAGAIIGGYFFGFAGVLAGSLPGDILIVSIWKPYLLFKKGFQIQIKYYWKNIILLLTVFVCCAFSTHYLSSLLPKFESNNYTGIAINAIVVITTFTTIYALSMYFLFQGMRIFAHRILQKMNQKMKKKCS